MWEMRFTSSTLTVRSPRAGPRPAGMSMLSSSLYGARLFERDSKTPLQRTALRLEEIQLVPGRYQVG